MAIKKDLKNYLIKAVYFWCVENKLTPYLEINNFEKNIIPQDIKENFKNNTTIIFNLSKNRVKNLEFKDNGILFFTNINSVIEEVYLDFNGISKIYCSEFKQGLEFNVYETNTKINEKKINNLKLIVDNTKD